MRDSSRHHVVHFGPNPDFVGGMGAVLRMMDAHQIGGKVEICPTWEPTSRWPAVFARSVFTLARLPRETIIHVHVSQGGSLLRKATLLRLAQARKLPRVVTIHGSTFPQQVRRRPRLNRQLLLYADAVVCLTEEVAELCRGLIPSVPVVVIPNPAQLRKSLPPVERTAPVALFAGEVGTRKGVDILSAAWRVVAGRMPEARCVALGPMADFAPPADELIEFLGPVRPDQVAKWIGKARLVVLPSRAEAMPMILLEAMGAGRPFVATPVGRIPELAEHGGCLVPVDSPESLAEQMITLLADPMLAKEIGNRGLRHCIKHWSPEAVGSHLEKVYDQARRRKPVCGG